MKKLVTSLMIVALATSSVHAAPPVWQNEAYTALKESNNQEALATFAGVLFMMAQAATIQDFMNHVEDKMVTSPLVSGEREVGVWGEKALELGNKSFELLSSAVFTQFPAVAQASEAVSDQLSEIEDPVARLNFLEGVYQDLLAIANEPRNWPDTLLPEAESEEGFEAEEEIVEEPAAQAAPAA